MIKKLFVLMSLGICVLNFSGCILLAAGAAGAGTAKWLSDKVTQEVDVGSDRVSAAAKDALKDMDIKVYKETSLPEVVQVLGTDKQQRKVWVDIHPIDAKNTRIDVRVGYINGEDDSRKILDAIVKKSKLWF